MSDVKKTEEVKEPSLVDEYNDLVQNGIPWEKLDGPFMGDAKKIIRKVVDFVGRLVKNIRSTQKRLDALEKAVAEKKS